MRCTGWCAARRRRSSSASSICAIGSRCIRATCSISARWWTRCARREPDEVYNLAAMSFVAVSWIQPTLTAEFTGVGVTRMLEAVREACPQTRFYQASSSEMFGKVRETPQTEQTPFYPRSPYGVAKAYGHHITVNYRESYDLCGVLGDPVQPRVARGAGWSSSRARSPGTRPRSSSAGATRCAWATSTRKRDWGYAKDYVEAMWLMLQQDDARRLRDRDRRDEHGAALRGDRLRPGRPGVGALRADRRRAQAPRRGRPAGGRLHQGAAAAGLEAADAASRS